MSESGPLRRLAPLCLGVLLVCLIYRAAVTPTADRLLNGLTPARRSSPPVASETPEEPSSPAITEEALDNPQPKMKDPATVKKSRYAIVTMATNKEYFPGIQTLAYSVSKWKQADTDLVVMVMNEERLAPMERIALQRVGFRIFPINFIAPPERPAAQFADQFSKLQLWTLDEYRRVLYMDGDMVSLKSQDDVLHGISDDVEFAASRDFGGRHRPIFNAGFISIRPSKKRFEEFMQWIKQKKVKYKPQQAEQAWLNSVFENKFFEVSFLHNTNSNVWFTNKKYWADLKPWLRGLHLTDSKAFKYGAADFDRKEEPHAIFYDMQSESIVKNGSIFGVITAAACDDVSKLQEIQTSIGAPMLVYVQCKDADLKAIRKGFTIVPLSGQTSCGKGQKPSDMMSSEGAKYVSEFCSAALLGNIAMINPLFVGYNYWIDITTLQKHGAAISAHLKKSLPSTSIPLDEFRALRVDGLGLDSPAVCSSVLGFGGVRFAAMGFSAGYARCGIEISGREYAAIVAAQGAATIRKSAPSCKSTSQC